jgi:hypothetical protein
VAKSESVGTAVKEHRSRTGARKIKSYIETESAVPKREPALIVRSTPITSERRAAALAQLPHNQRVVFEAMYLADPPATQFELAAKRNVSRTAIFNLEKKARHWTSCSAEEVVNTGSMRVVPRCEKAKGTQGMGRPKKSGRRKEITGGYQHRLEMRRGTFKGEADDGVMRDICGNHLALVAEGAWAAFELAESWSASCN